MFGPKYENDLKHGRIPRRVVLLSETRLKTGAIVEGTIDHVTERGLGLILDLHRPVLVPNTLPGERVRVRITHLGAHQGAGVVETVLSPSEYRIPPICPHVPVCGGCDFGCMDYGTQLRLKSGFVIDAMEAAHVPFDASALFPIIAAPEPLHYRNKLIFNVKFAHPHVIAGLFERHSHRTVDIDSCPLQEELINRAVAHVKRAIVDRRWPVYHESRKTGSLRGFSLRSGTDGRLLLTLVARRQNLPELEEQAAAWLREIEGLAGVLLNLHPEDTNAVFSDETILVNGAATVTSRVRGIDFQVGPTAFFQVNTAQTEQMLTSISRSLGGCDRLVDAYCGTGLPGLPLARDIPELVGIDIDPRAVAAATAGAERNRIPHARFLQGDVEQILPHILEEKPHQRTTLLIDPPRKGLSEPLRRFLASAPAQQIVYVSCNPGTLARDLEALCNGGYRIQGLQPLDMFPQTRHVECIAFLSR